MNQSSGLVGLAIIELATSALSGRSVDSRRVPTCPAESQCRCSVGTSNFSSETRWDPAGRAGTPMLGQSWDRGQPASTRDGRRREPDLRPRRDETRANRGRSIGISTAARISCPNSSNCANSEHRGRGKWIALLGWRGWSRVSRRLREDTERSGVPDRPLTSRQ